MPIRLAQSALDEMRHLKVSTLALAHTMQARMVESDVWDICGLRVQVRVKRERHRGKETYFARWYVNGKGRGENSLAYSLRRLEAA